MISVEKWFVIFYLHRQDWPNGWTYHIFIIKNRWQWRPIISPI